MPQKLVQNTYEQLIRYYVYYSGWSRVARRGEEAELQKLQDNPDHEAILPDPDSDKKPVSKSWARLIKKVYEVDPLRCPKWGG